MRPVEQERPTIKIYLSANSGRDATLRELLFGVEEESIPFELVETDSGDALSLAWEASKTSRLEVGLGLDRDNLVLHYSKLEKGQPLFRISARAPEEQVRSIGANAARLVKKLPFKPL